MAIMVVYDSGDQVLGQGLRLATDYDFCDGLNGSSGQGTTVAEVVTTAATV